MNKRKIRFKKMSKNKRNFISDMKWNKEINHSKTFPVVTIGAFGICKYLKGSEV